MTHAGDLQDGHDLELYVSLGTTSAGEVEDVPIHANEPAFRFCPRCGRSLASRQLKSGDPPRLVCGSCGFIFYLDPKVAVGTIIRSRDGRIVLVKRAIEPGYGRWVFPGGYVDRGEDVPAAALREALEECGLTIALDGLINIYSYPGRTPVIIVYAATILQGELTLDEESLEARLFAPAELPWDELAFASTTDALRDYLSGMIHPHVRPAPTRPGLDTP